MNFSFCTTAWGGYDLSFSSTLLHIVRCATLLYVFTQMSDCDSALLKYGRITKKVCAWCYTTWWYRLYIGCLNLLGFAWFGLSTNISMHVWWAPQIAQTQTLPHLPTTSAIIALDPMAIPIAERWKLWPAYVDWGGHRESAASPHSCQVMRQKMHLKIIDLWF